MVSNGGSSNEMPQRGMKSLVNEAHQPSDDSTKEILVACITNVQPMTDHWCLLVYDDIMQVVAFLHHPYMIQVLPYFNRITWSAAVQFWHTRPANWGCRREIWHTGY